MQGQLSEFSVILLFIIGGIIFLAGGLFTSRLVRPKRPNEEKNTTYECGEDTVGNGWGNFNPRFYIVALIFILFEVEIIFLFPWSTVFANKEIINQTPEWGWFALGEMFVFLVVLTLGLVYAWNRGYLDWVKPQPKVSDYKGNVPVSDYEEFNSNT